MAQKSSPLATSQAPRQATDGSDLTCKVYNDGHHQMASYGSFVEPALATLLQPVL
jgi:hypothetical protein